MRDYLIWHIPSGTARPVAEHTTPELEDILRAIADGRCQDKRRQCSAEQMSERIRIELTAREIGAV